MLTLPYVDSFICQLFHLLSLNLSSTLHHRHVILRWPLLPLWIVPAPQHSGLSLLRESFVVVARGLLKAHLVVCMRAVLQQLYCGWYSLSTLASASSCPAVMITGHIQQVTARFIILH